ncbi:MAG: O-antigen ligase family protein [Chloroflexi bacterium]|nr:O-antigen ligase family protein [Chloroflexota bacterium]
MNSTQAKSLNARERALQTRQQHERHIPWVEAILDNPALLIIIGAAHFLIAFYVRESETTLSTAHGIISMLIGLYWATNKRIPLVYSVYAVAYIAGCEVMWRQNEFAVFWEAGKYFSVVILFAAWLRSRTSRLPTTPVLYILFLLPGIVLSITQSYGFKDLLSPNATGPLAIFASILFFSTMRLTSDQVRRAFIAYVIPIAGVAGIVMYRVSTLDISWTGESSNTASGFGANQVSTALGLGWFFLVAAVITFSKARTRVLLSILMVLAAIWILIENFYTFSRGGLAGSVASTVLLLLFLLPLPSRRMIALAGFAAAGLFAALLFPFLDRTTQGQLAVRYIQQTEEEDFFTARDRIASDEISLFLQFPFTGVGMGRGIEIRSEQFGYRTAPHTEYTRLLAEHGMAGLAANLVLLIMVIQAVRRQENGFGRALAVALVVWALFYMTHAATRTVAPSLALGLASAALAVDLPNERARREKTFKRPMPMMVKPEPQGSGD